MKSLVPLSRLGQGFLSDVTREEILCGKRSSAIRGECVVLGAVREYREDEETLLWKNLLLCRM